MTLSMEGVAIAPAGVWFDCRKFVRQDRVFPFGLSAAQFERRLEAMEAQVSRNQQAVRRLIAGGLTATDAADRIDNEGMGLFASPLPYDDLIETGKP